MAPSKLHFLMFPLPAQGHINPMLHLSSLLLLRDCSITFLNTERSHHSILSALASPPHSPSSFRFVTIPDGLPATFSVTVNPSSFCQLLDALEQHQGVLEQLLERFNAAGDPVSCIITEFCLPWVQDVSNKFGIPRVLFWASSATAFYVTSPSAAGSKSPKVEDERPSDLQEIVELFYDDMSLLQAVLKIFDRVEESHCVLVNSFHELEASFLPAAPRNVKCIGPCLLTDAHKIKQAVDGLGNVGGSLLKEDVECLRWLDAQEERSVLFISLGSVGSFQPAQIEEISLGIEASNHKFLWVARPDTQTTNSFPDGFQQRTKDRGLIISWAPQLKVLEHASLGAFLTHCGWNSTLESLFMGVPMLCFPVFAEQPLNAHLVEKMLKVGMGFEKRGDGVVERGEVERAVREIMEGEEGSKVRIQAQKIKESARRAVDEEGSSCTQLTMFLDELVRMKTPHH